MPFYSGPLMHFLSGVDTGNLIFWPGSAICIDPKGELATITASRRSADGSEWSEPMRPDHGKVYALDPFRRVTGPARASPMPRSIRWISTRHSMMFRTLWIWQRWIGVWRRDEKETPSPLVV
jgi:hypothetical protein